MMRPSLIALALALGAPAYAQEAGDVPAKDAKPDAAKPDKDAAKASVEEDEQPQRRSIPLRGHSLAYTVTPGHLTIRNDKGEPTASMFYTAYTVPSAGRARPVTFLFNGGPGSSTMWLHMGSFGPIKVDASVPETIAGPPFRYGANPDTLLDVTDLVFIDAPTTGLSREIGKAEPKDFFGVDKDADAFTRTIQRYLSKYGRWNSPKFIIGESYGTTRAGALSKSLSDAGVQLNGIVLVSTVLNIGLFGGDDQTLVNFLPTYAADAWYHGKVRPKPELMSFVAEAKAFASGPYAAALQKGGALSEQEKQSVAQQMARLTGLSTDYVMRSNLRVPPNHFQRELLRDRRQIIGRIDSRFVGTEPDAAGDSPSYDPQASAISGAFVGAFNDYLYRDLGYKTALTFRPNNYAGIGNDWNFQHNAPEGQQFVANVASDLAQAMRENPRLKLLNVAGVYDLATPFFGAEYDLGHMALEPQIVANIRYAYYPAGHMMYIDPPSARQLKADIASFYATAE
ncbi:S10 family peptidase [Sphingomonas sp. URHD0057]|uniref:S10 family peptidase n=1 Tax=Sphingomonas sp. URHD0057 TaxID=1380389 RepID=UPI0018CC62E0|nr:peptidase S10 [Sphingomonas sp. URHD0057]